MRCWRLSPRIHFGQIQLLLCVLELFLDVCPISLDLPLKLLADGWEWPIRLGLVAFPDFEAISWFGLLAPAGTPAAVISKVHADIVQIAVQADVRERIAQLGLEVVP